MQELQSSDLVAVGPLDRLHQRGVRVPQDVSITRFDDVPVSTLTSPNFTTMNSPRIQGGGPSVALLLAAAQADGAVSSPSARYQSSWSCESPQE
jgi:DNA-binding LacI/PurR family transcriptional regulator